MEGYSISQTAQRFGVEPHTLRFYEKEGIITPAKQKWRPGVHRGEHLSAGNGHVPEEHRNAPERDQALFRPGGPGKSTVEERLQIFTGHRQRVLEEIQELQRHLEKIEHKIQRLKQAEGR